MANIIEISGSGSSGAVLIPKTITNNGEYSASDDGADGYDVVTVSVSGGGGNYSDNMFDGTLVPNTYINRDNGNEVSYSGWSSTDFIDVSNISEFYLCSNAVWGADKDYNAFYDSGKNFISKFYLSTKITVPSSAKYMRISGKTSDITGAKMFCAV